MCLYTSIASGSFPQNCGKNGKIFIFFGEHDMATLKASVCGELGLSAEKPEMLVPAKLGRRVDARHLSSRRLETAAYFPAVSCFLPAHSHGTGI